MPTQYEKVSIFAVYSEGALLCEQDNRPTFNVQYAGAASWTWTVASTDGFSGQPHFWITTPDPSNTGTGKLNWSGIDYQDWELGRKGTVSIECRSTAAVVTLSIEVAVRSIDVKDLTFFAPMNHHVLTVCAPCQWGSYAFNVKYPTDDKVTPIWLDAAASEQMIDFSLSDSNGAALFDEPADSWVTLEITVKGRASRFRLRISIRPLRVDKNAAFPCESPLELVYGETLKLSIQGEPAVPNGFVWSLDAVEIDSFKLTPAFAPLGRGPSATLDLQGVSDWDWINGTQGGYAELVVKDGRRQESRCSIHFDLERSSRRFSLTEGTELQGPGGEVLEVDADGDYLPVGMDGTKNARILLENVPVRSKEDGAAANLPAETLFTFVEPQPLLGTVVAQTAGLTKGADDETDRSLRDRVRVLWADPPAHGNRSHMLQIAWQVPGVDRAFLYAPFALGGPEALGKVGCALVAPGHRAGVRRDSSLADEVRKQLALQGSLTAEYVIMDVNDRGEPDADGKGACQVDLEVQLRLADEADWKWPAAQNLVLAGLPSDTSLEVFYDPTDEDKARQVRDALGAIVKGDMLHVLGQSVTVLEVDDQLLRINLSGALTDENGSFFDPTRVVGARIYPPCPLEVQVLAAIQDIFDHLGTSETEQVHPEFPWQRRYPLSTFIYPDELRRAEVTNQLMDIDGIVDLRVVWPEENVVPPPNKAQTDDTGEQFYTTYILSLRRLALGPLRPTPGVDGGYPGPPLP